MHILFCFYSCCVIYFSLLTWHFQSCLNPISILSASDVCECCIVLYRNPFYPMAIWCPPDVKYFWCERAITGNLKSYINIYNSSKSSLPIIEFMESLENHDGNFSTCRRAVKICKLTCKISLLWKLWIFIIRRILKFDSAIFFDTFHILNNFSQENYGNTNRCVSGDVCPRIIVFPLPLQWHSIRLLTSHLHWFLGPFLCDTGFSMQILQCCNFMCGIKYKRGKRFFVIYSSALMTNPPVSLSQITLDITYLIP